MSRLNLNPENELELFGLDMEALYSLFKTIVLSEGDIGDDVLEQVNYGIGVKFHIMYFIEEMYTIKHKAKTVVLLDGSEIDLEAFWDERENRKALMQKVALEHMQSKDLFKGDAE